MNHQPFISTAALLILIIESAAVMVCFGFWFTKICQEIQDTIKQLTTKKEAP